MDISWSIFFFLIGYFMHFFMFEFLLFFSFQQGPALTLLCHYFQVQVQLLLTLTAPERTLKPLPVNRITYTHTTYFNSQVPVCVFYLKIHTRMQSRCMHWVLHKVHALQKSQVVHRAGFSQDHAISFCSNFLLEDIDLLLQKN